MTSNTSDKLKMGLNMPPEPVEIKNFIKGVRKRIEEMEGPQVFDDWMNSTAVWYGNRLPSYLWNMWRDKLVSLGYSWQSFLKVLRRHTEDLILWALYDKISWEQLVYKIIDSIEKYRK